MKTDVDACLRNMADWYVKNRREMTAPEFDAILKKHCESEAEQQKMVKFIDSEAGQARFKTLLRERKQAAVDSQLPPEGTKHPVHCVKCGWEGYRTHGPLQPCPKCGGVVVWTFSGETKPEAAPDVRLTNEWTEEENVVLRCFDKSRLKTFRRHAPLYSVFDCSGMNIEEFAQAVYQLVEVKHTHYLEPIRSSTVKTLVGKERQFHEDFANLWWKTRGVKPTATPVLSSFSTLVERERPSLLQESEPCEIVPPQYFDMLGLLDSVPPSSLLYEPEVKERKIDEILKKLKDGVATIHESAVFREFLVTMSKFWDYSIGNQILIMIQKRDATRVAGFYKWKDLGRYVKAGEKGITILAPCLPPKGTVEEIWQKNSQEWVLRGRYVYVRSALVQTFPSKGEAERWLLQQGAHKVSEEEVSLGPRYFKVVYVFDISQTEGKPLPEFKVPVLTGAANEELFDKVLGLVKGQGLEASFESRPQQDPEIKGMYFGKTIWVRPEESRAQQLKTLIHETAHYYTESVFRIPRADAETIAESAAFAVGAHFGFDSGVRSFSYVALWAKDKKVLEQNLGAVRRVATAIITALEAVKAVPA